MKKVKEKISLKETVDFLKEVLWKKKNKIIGHGIPIRKL